MPIPWRAAMADALYGRDGFFTSGAGPAAHFRTSVHATPAFAAALWRLVAQVDAALGHPDRLDVVDVGAGRGELLRTLAALAVPGPDTGPESAGPPAHRLRLTAVEVAPRPADLPPDITWSERIPDGITGVLLGTEWLDNVPLDAAVHDGDAWRYLLVDPATGEETVGGPVDPADASWLATWWPPPPAAGAEPGPPTGPPAEPGPDLRAEIGRTRDDAWAAAVAAVDRGLAVAVDYGHLRAGRPADGTLTGYRTGRQVPPVPDGSCDLTAHVAVDAVAAAGESAAGTAYTLVRQREALRALGADGGRPPLALAATDPAGYVRALAAASTVAELTDPAGLGGHWWLLQPVGVDPTGFLARWRA